MFTVYTMFDEEGNLLYAGQTANWGRRLADHAYKAEWFAEVKSVRTEEVATRELAKKLEWRVITEGKPRHNMNQRQVCPRCHEPKTYRPGQAYCNPCYRNYQRARRRVGGVHPPRPPTVTCPKCGGIKDPGPSYCRPCKNDYNDAWRRR